MFRSDKGPTALETLDFALAAHQLFHRRRKMLNLCQEEEGERGEKQ